MNSDDTAPSLAVLVETDLHFTLLELSRVCGADREQIEALVHEGVLSASGDAPETWRFAGDSLRRARTAQRLTRDLGLNVAATALVIELLDEIEALKASLRCLDRR